MANSSGGEYLSLHIGQAGINIGNKCWELYCLEHEIQKDGTLCKNNNNNNNMFDNNHKLNAFFELSSNNRYYSRAIFIDFESDVIDTIRKSSNSFFDPQQFICGTENASNCFSRGFYNYDQQFNESVYNRIRYELERCDSRIQGIQLMSSLCGGTGSGYASYLLQELQDLHDKKLTFQQLSIIPSLNSCGSQQTSIDIYNTILSLYYNLLYSGLTVLFDNQALYHVYDTNYLFKTEGGNGTTTSLLTTLRPAKMAKHFHQPQSQPPRPIISFNEINNILTHAITKLTSTLRFESTINKTMCEQQLNLQLQNQSDRLHFPIISYAPIVPKHLQTYSNNTLLSITNACLYSSNQLLKLRNNNNYKILNGCLVYACDQKHIQNQNVLDKKLFEKNYQQFKHGFVDHNLQTLPNDLLALPNRTALLLANSFDIIDIWSELLQKYYKMYKRNAFVHWYVNEGMEMELFETAYLSLKQLRNEYSLIFKNKS